MKVTYLPITLSLINNIATLHTFPAFKDETKVPFTTSRIDELLLHQKVDVVCINSPPFLHSQIAVKTLGIGKNVLCDRPAGLEHNDTVKMIEAAR